jgi:CDP-glucose 4,6-dehydratase
LGQRNAAVEDVVNGRPDPEFWQGRKVLLTGHTGFKGSWAALWLREMGAEVHGFSLAPESEPSLWAELGGEVVASEVLADLADREAVRRAVETVRPEIVLHMAAQALVRRSYLEPVETVATNALGTVHLLDALRGSPGLRAVLVITTDKVYANNDCGRDFVEDDPLGGHDPYSASKAAAEILTRSFAASFFEGQGIPVATARAGNVVGGGDWSADRLIPDVCRAARGGTPLRLRFPDATRPWQHVLEPIAGYLTYAQALAGDPGVPRALNFGPMPGTAMTVSQVADAVSAALGLDRAWTLDTGDHPPEMRLLSLDPSRAAESIGWTPRLDARETIEWTASWYAAHAEGGPARDLCLQQIKEYEALLR